jgi:hypothetical protein
VFRERAAEGIVASCLPAKRRSALDKVQAVRGYLDAPDFQKFWEADAARLGAVVRRMGKLE